MAMTSELMQEQARRAAIAALPHAQAHGGLARYLTHYTGCSEAEAKAVLAAADAGGDIMLPPLAAWTNDCAGAVRSAADHREHLRATYRIPVDTAVETLPAASTSAAPASSGWEAAFAATAARPAHSPSSKSNTMASAIDAAISALKKQP